MSLENPHFSSTKKLMRAVEESEALGQKRDYVADMKDFLRLEGIKWKTHFEQEQIPDKPTIFVANHFRRLRIDRLLSINTFLNTRESMITTSLISLEAVKLTQRRISWLVEDQVKEKFLSFKLPDPSIQKAMVRCYDSIPVPQKPGISVFRKSLEALRNGKHLGVYPEGKANYIVRAYDKRFEGLLTVLQRSHTQFQIVPVGIYFKNGSYRVNFGKTIESFGKPLEIAKEAMSRIASKLPKSLLPPL